MPSLLIKDEKVNDPEKAAEMVSILSFKC